VARTLVEADDVVEPGQASDAQPLSPASKQRLDEPRERVGCLSVAEGERDDLPDPALTSVALELALRTVKAYVEIRIFQVDADHPVPGKDDGAKDGDARHLERERLHLEVGELHVEDRAEPILLLDGKDGAHVLVHLARGGRNRLRPDPDRHPLPVLSGGVPPGRP
jgi:hypothetical protein